MKTRGRLLLLAGLCLLLGMLFAACASENAAQAVHSEHIGVLAGGAQTQPAQDVNLKIDASGLSRPYNARPVNYPSCTASVPEPRVAYTWYKKVGSEYREIADPPTFVGEYRVTVYVIDGVGYTGEDSVDFSITPAYFKPIANDTFPYTGASVFRVDAAPACGEDRISYEVAFESANVGTAISYIRFYGEHAENYVMDPDYAARILPVTLDISALQSLSAQKVYDATDLVAYTLDHGAHKGIFAGDVVNVVISTGVRNVFSGAATGTVVRCDNPNYTFVGDVTLQLTVQKAVFVPPAEVLYTGSSRVTLQLPTGIGKDVLTLDMRFTGKNAGSVLLENGVTLTGEQAGNYTLVENPTSRIVKRRLEIPTLGEITAKKTFDGTNALELRLKTGISTANELRILGTVDVTYPCKEVKTVFRVSETNDPNYLLDGEFEITLTVEKAQLKLSGTPELCYNGYSERYIDMNADFVAGGVANHPVFLKAVFESDAPGAAFLYVAICGENSAYYELDTTEFAPKIVTATLRFGADALQFAANGDSTRVLRGARSPYLTAIAHGDEVYALLRFTSAEAGATLMEVTLLGADAYKYVLDTSDFTAVIK